MNINIQFDPSVSSAPAGFTAAVAAAVQFLDSQFTAPVTITIDVGYGEVEGQALVAGALGESIGLYTSVSYAQLQSALPAGLLPTTDPTPQGSSLEITTAEATALGLSIGDGVNGYVGFSSTAPFTYDPNNRAVAGKYDFIGVFEHEITEVMGRVSLLGWNQQYSLMDLFRFSAPGIRSLSPNQAAYFSIDGGQTNLNNFNTLAGGDQGDWAASAGHDAFLAFNPSGVMNSLSAADITLMNTLGYGSSSSSPAGPAISSVVEQPSTGDLSPGKTAVITLNFSASVAVAGGTPTLTLNDGGTATYMSDSGGNALNFSYTVGAQDTSVASLAVTAVNLNGATIKDSSGNAASLSLVGLAQNGPQIDTIGPSVTAVVQQPATGDLNAGKTVTIALKLSEAVTVAEGIPSLTLNDGGTASYTSSSGGSVLNFSYTIGAHDSNVASLAVTSVNLNGATITDGVGNAANLALAGLTQNGPQIDITNASVIGIIEQPSTGYLSVGNAVTITVDLSEAVTVAGGIPTLAFNDGGAATYTGGSGSTALNFLYTVSSHDSNVVSLAATAVNLNGATVADGAGNPANFSFAGLNQNGPHIDASVSAQNIESDYLAIVRTALPVDQATTIANSINAGTQTEAQYVSGLLSQVADTTIPAVAVEASMYGVVGSTAEITSLATQFLPPQVNSATTHGLNSLIYASETLGLAFAFGNETGSTAFATAFGPGNADMPSSAAGDAAFAAAAASTIFGSASTANLVNAIEGWLSNWKAFYSHGIPGISDPTAAQIDLAARGAAWGDATGVALANNLGLLHAEASNFLADAAQGTAVYSAAFSSQPSPTPFQGGAAEPVVSATDLIPLLGIHAF